MRSDCPLNYGLEIFGDRWTLLIIRDLMFFGKRYYSEFLASAEGVSTNILADRLNMLEQEHIIKKEPDSTHKQKLIYNLTRKGIDLMPLIMEIGLWSDKYASGLNPGRGVIIGEVKRNRSQGIIQMRKKLEREHLKPPSTKPRSVTNHSTSATN